MLFDILNHNYSAREGVIIFLIVLLAFFISVTFHEFSHGYAAYKMGDLTPKLAGRLTLNPIRHMSPVGFFMFIFLRIGWAKPVPVNPMNFKRYRKGVRIVSLAGVGANFILGLIAALIHLVLINNLTTINEPIFYLIMFLQYMMVVNSLLIMFNILPICPLDGFNFISSFCSADNKFVKASVRNSGKIILSVLLIAIFIEIFTGIDIWATYLYLCYDFIFGKIAFLGV
ncbi:MAG: site-2 protease family protein [Clostridia bacterium]|nr:site-2 protease family protein [Clostridia bacterium]